MFNAHYMRAVLRYGVIISYAHPGAVATIGTSNIDNYSSQSHSCPAPRRPSYFIGISDYSVCVPAYTTRQKGGGRDHGGATEPAGVFS